MHKLGLIENYNAIQTLASFPHANNSIIKSRTSALVICDSFLWLGRLVELV